MQNAPVPPEIKDKPLYYYQYLEKLLETHRSHEIAGVRVFSVGGQTARFAQPERRKQRKCREAFCPNELSLGSDYAKLAEKMLREPEIPATLTSAEREELSFHLQDIIYELQDKAIFALEDAMNLRKREHMASVEWFDKIMLGLARLSPEKYGKAVFVRATGRHVLRTGRCGRTASRDGTGKTCPDAGWIRRTEIQGLRSRICRDMVPYIWHPGSGNAPPPPRVMPGGMCFCPDFPAMPRRT